jgi:polysaccharide chain length determinant protein (PEP-CTERM system associated)
MNLDLGFYWRLFLRRLPVMAGLFLLCGSVGLILAIQMPTTYESSALLMVEEPEIPSDLASTTVRTSPSEEIQVIRQQLMTRANLIDIANEFPIFSDIRTMSPDDVVDEMNRRTRIFISGGSNRRGANEPTLVSVRFEAGSATVASNVVNEYVTRITNASVRERTGQAEDTLQFFEQEVERLDGELSARSARITEFQSRHSEALPDSINYRMGRQTLLLERMRDATRERAGLIERRKQLVDLFEATGQVGNARSAPQLSQAERDLQDLEDNLKKALVVYSETNPRIVQLRKRIELQREEVAAERADSSGEEITPSKLLDIQLADIDQQIETLDTEIKRSEAELSELEKSISQTPGNAITLESMKRDYENIRRQYDSAVASLSKARLGEQIELTARGQRITLIEPASVPTSPARPNRPMIAATGVAAGAGLAFAFFMLMEFLNRTVRRPAEVTSGLGITPLATIPFIETAFHRRMRRTAQIAALAAVIIGVPAALWAIDTYYLPLDLLAQRLLGQIGLT